MTRVEMIAGLDEDVREKFLHNLVERNPSNHFKDYWMNKTDFHENEGIGGAFSWGNTNEGFEYWQEVDNNLISKL